jgi:hypothetical protein
MGQSRDGSAGGQYLLRGAQGACWELEVLLLLLRFIVRSLMRVGHLANPLEHQRMSTRHHAPTTNEWLRVGSKKKRTPSLLPSSEYRRFAKRTGAGRLVAFFFLAPCAQGSAASGPVRHHRQLPTTTLLSSPASPTPKEKTAITSHQTNKRKTKLHETPPNPLL